MTKFVNMISDIDEVNGVITAHVNVPAGSVWFDGHFPEQAILPGVAQLALVVEILGEALNKTVYASDVSRVRFKQAILPAEPIEVQITPKGNGTKTYGFRLRNGDSLACSGFLKLRDL
jgi:3-hydroxymyristoyl/3-hydroxydecanoyl-(acyl carrier protein) dehydratase